MITVSKVKKSVGVSLAPVLQEEVCKLSHSGALIEVLPGKKHQNQHEKWLRENKESIEAVSHWIDMNGSFSHYQRSF